MKQYQDWRLVSDLLAHVIIHILLFGAGKQGSEVPSSYHCAPKTLWTQGNMSYGTIGTQPIFCFSDATK